MQITCAFLMTKNSTSVVGMRVLELSKSVGIDVSKAVVALGITIDRNMTLSRSCGPKTTKDLCWQSSKEIMLSHFGCEASPVLTYLIDLSRTRSSLFWLKNAQNTTEPSPKPSLGDETCHSDASGPAGSTQWWGNTFIEYWFYWTCTTLGRCAAAPPPPRAGSGV